MPQGQLKMLMISLFGILKGYAKKAQDFRELFHGSLVNFYDTQLDSFASSQENTATYINFFTKKLD